MAHDLIHYVKKMRVSANYFDPKSTSAFEFARQMGSTKLKQTNPSFDFAFDVNFDLPNPAVIQAEFVNGKTWEKTTGSSHCEDLRNEFFQICQDIDDYYDKTGESRPNQGPAVTESATGKGSKGASKGGKK